MRYVIIGGDAAGMSAAMQIVRNDSNANITTLERGPIYSYAQCGLPYVVGGFIESTDRLIARDVNTFREKYGIDARVFHEVTKVDPTAKKVYGKNLKTNESFDIEYDRLLIATGADPIIPDWPGKDLSHIHTVKTIPDTQRLLEDLDDARHITIVGGGYIGLEMAENFVEINKKVTIIQRGQQLANIFDEDLATLISDEAEKHGVEVCFDESVESFRGEGQVEYVITNKAERKTDLVIIAIGVSPNTTFLEGTGIELHENKAIIVNPYMETNIKDIYAAGDCAMQFHRLKNKLDYIPLGTHANKQGRIAGLNMVGKQREFQGVVGTSILKFFDLSLGRTGLSQKEAAQLEIPYASVEAELPHIAGYYPNPQRMKLKILFRKDNRQLLGGQIIGKEGVDKRIDVLATALYQQLTLDQLEDLDLAYAPPFNGVWDPIQQAARRAKA